jgi:hypothetical protein
LKVIRQIFENLLPAGLEWLLPFGNKFEKESGELFSIYSHSRGVFGGLFFHEYKIKNTKKLYYRTESFFVHFQQLMTHCQIEKYVVTKKKLKQNTKYNYSHLDNVLRLFSL